MAPRGQEPPLELLADHAALLARTRQHLAVLLRPADEVGHHLVDSAVREVLEDAVALLPQREGDVVRHPEELPEGDRRAPAAVEAPGGDAVLGHAGEGVCHRVAVVRGDHEPAAARRHALQHSVDAPVKAARRGFKIGVNGVGVALLSRPLALEHEVRPSHELRPEGEALPLRPLDIEVQPALAAPQVGLVGVVDHGLALAVVLPLQFQDQLVDGGLEVGVFGVHHHPHVRLRRLVHQLSQPLPHRREELQLLFFQDGLLEPLPRLPCFPPEAPDDGVHHVQPQLLAPL